MSRALASWESASDLIRFPVFDIQNEAQVFSGAGKCVLVGMMHNLPFFLDLDAAVNPHVFICGITGSGKTYLMKNLMLKLALFSDAEILLIDFTGEYEAFAKTTSLVRYSNLKGAGDEKTKTKLADEILNQALERMRHEDLGRKRVFVMLDEAWKLLGSSKPLITLLREGRKYGYGLLFSSQLIEDVDIAMLSNVATVFVFRLQNKQGLNKLAGNYGLRQRQVELIQGLGVGSCAVLQMQKSGKRSFFHIEKVHGMEADETIKLKNGAKMQIEITRRKFEETVGSVCPKDVVSAAIAMSEREGYVDLAFLIDLFLKNGTDSRTVLATLRKLGIDDASAAESFATVLSQAGKTKV
jgi:hypothetical protein